MIDITPADQEIVTEILKKYVPHTEVRVFGSRHKWTAKPYSDLDLAIVGDAKLDKQIIYNLEEAFEESELSFRVDVIDWYAISDEFRAIIKQGYTVIQEKTNPLPAGWIFRKLGHIIDFNPTEKLPKGNLAKKISMEQLQPYTRKITDYEIANFNGGSKFKNKDTLLARITPCLENGKTAYVDILTDNEIGFGSTEFIVLREKENLTDNKFIYYLATSPDFRDKAIKSMTGSSGRQRVQIDELITYEMAIPPIDEQKEIAAILSSLDDKIELNQQINKKLEEVGQTIFKEWFIDFNFSDENGHPYRDSGGAMIDSELGQIPASCSIKSLDEIAEFINGLAMQKFRPTEHEKSLPVLKIKELRQGNTDTNSDRCTIGIPDNVKISDGDVIFSWSGSLMVDLWAGGKAGLNQHLFKVTSDKYSKAFYYLWIKHYLARFIAIAQDKATTMGHIQRKHLADAKVFCPNDKIMQKFNDVITPIFEKIIAKNIEIRMLTYSRDNLLPKLMSGGILA